MAWILGSLLGAVAGCSPLSRYAESRLLDLWDVVPVSVRCGPGVKVTVSATEFIGTGIGGGTATAAGLAPGRWGPVWDELSIHLLVYSLESWTLPPKGRELHRWPGSRSIPCEMRSGEIHARHFGNVLVFLCPTAVGPDGFATKGATAGSPGMETPWHSWANVEVDVLFGLGVRAGLCPDELVDFLVGLFGFDLIGDDLGAYESSWEEADS